MDDLFTEFRYSQDLRSFLREICLIVNLPFNVPKERIAHRWLSVYDVLCVIVQMMNAFIMMYFLLFP
jgi:hypothetical protein